MTDADQKDDARGRTGCFFEVTLRITRMRDGSMGRGTGFSSLARVGHSVKGLLECGAAILMESHTGA
jgi:hypothetical protein